MVPQIYKKDPISGQILQPTNACQCHPTHKIQSKYQCKMQYFTIKYTLLSQ